MLYTIGRKRADTGKIIIRGAAGGVKREFHVKQEG